MYGKKSGAARSKLVLPPSPPASPTTSPSSALNAVYSVTSKPPKPQPETYLPNITPAATKPEAVKRKNSGAITSFFAQNAQMRKKLKSAATTATTATTTSSTTSSTSSSVSTPPLNAPNKTQYYLDFGQKSFDKSIVCATCQFRYLPSDVGEVKTHKSLCAEFTKGVQFLPPANTTVCRPTIPVPDNTKTSVGLTVVSASIPKGVAVYYIPPSLKFPTVHAKLSSVKKIIDLQVSQERTPLLEPVVLATRFKKRAARACRHQPFEARSQTASSAHTAHEEPPLSTLCARRFVQRKQRTQSRSI